MTENPYESPEAESAAVHRPSPSLRNFLLASLALLVVIGLAELMRPVIVDIHMNYGLRMAYLAGAIEIVVLTSSACCCLWFLLFRRPTSVPKRDRPSSNDATAGAGDISAGP